MSEHSLVVGQKVYALNPKYGDGTRLRTEGHDKSSFNGVWAPNDTALTVLALAEGFVQVKKQDGQEGWIRARNLSLVGRVPGVTRDVVTSEMVTPDPEYVKGIKIYNLGIKEDPVPGQKFGKGLQHLISSQWLSAISEFVGAHFPQLQSFARHAHQSASAHPGYDFIYFTNMANHLFHRADVLGLRAQEARDLFLMSTWLVMAAAEVDDFPFSKYTPAERAAQRASFYEMYLSPRPGPGVVKLSRDDAASLGKFAAPTSRRDLLPPIALERLGINNELSALKYADPELPLREGFLVSTRIDSLKRHFEGVHRRLTDEDHVTHLLWNFHAIYHVLEVFPDKNDLIDYSATHQTRSRPHLKYEPTTSLQKIASKALPAAEVLKLDWNEGALPPPPSVSAALLAYIQAADGAFLKWYPHLAGGAELRALLASYCGVIEENLLITNGSDDALILLCHSYLSTKKAVLAPVPTYEHFCANAIGAGASLIRLETEDPFTAEPDALAAAIEEHKPEMVYLVSPNNPTGVQWSLPAIRSLATRYPKLIFLIDEAYYEFGAAGEDGALISCAALAAERENVVVTRTFSKAFCLASVRCGYVIAHPNTIETLRAYYNPKSVNQFAQIAAYHALKEVESYYRPYIKATNSARESFLQELKAHELDARSGGAGNFVCVRVPDGQTAELCRRLEEQSIYVRDISGRFPGYIRITIGLEMQRVAEALIAALRAMDAA